MSAQSPATKTAIVPFWNRLPAVMLYPAHFGAMATIVMLGLARICLVVPLFGWILALLATVAMYRYAFECLRSSADGYLEPPEVGLSVDRSVGRKMIWLMIILTLVAAFGMVLLGPVLGWILLLFIGVSLPGATMTLALEESLTAALDPTKWINIFMRIGWPYLALVGLCFVILLSQGYASTFVVKLMPIWVALGVIGIISNYATVMTFHLMGYLLYQYHEELGLVPEAPQLVRQMAPANPDQPLLDQVGALVSNGKHEEATELLRKQVRRGAMPAVHAQFRKLLRLGDNKAELLDHGRDYLDALLDQGDDQTPSERIANDRTAMEILRESQALDPTFAPSTSARVMKLARKAAQLGQPQAALLLVSGFPERYPKSQFVAESVLFAATLLHENMSQDEQAVSLLRNLKATLPNDPLMPEIDAKLQAIERMLAATKRSQRPTS
ncbi:MAG TPA: hypothetical protein VK660_05155 [Xanthomonadaceae bacterium]|jgi:hypothetical protein|nr:hypothetical protein [Xanthomonadaceae bacterium]